MHATRHHASICVVTRQAMSIICILRCRDSHTTAKVIGDNPDRSGPVDDLATDK